MPARAVRRRPSWRFQRGGNVPPVPGRRLGQPRAQSGPGRRCGLSPSRPCGRARLPSGCGPRFEPARPVVREYRSRSVQSLTAAVTRTTRNGRCSRRGGLSAAPSRSVPGDSRDRDFRRVSPPVRYLSPDRVTPPALASTGHLDRLTSGARGCVVFSLFVVRARCSILRPRTPSGCARTDAADPHYRDDMQPHLWLPAIPQPWTWWWRR